MYNKLCNDFTEKLAFHTAPTLLGIKCASLVSLVTDDYELCDQCESFNKKVAVKGLKSRIQNIWEDKDSLDTIIYIVIKNVVIKYYANFYKSNYGQNTILEFCNAILEIKETEAVKTPAPLSTIRVRT